MTALKALLVLGVTYTVLAAVAYLGEVTHTPMLSRNGGALLAIAGGLIALVIILTPRRRRRR